MELNNYWSDIDTRLNALCNDGYTKLPSISNFNIEDTAENIYKEMNGNTFSELCSSHKAFIDRLLINEQLVPKLFKIAKTKMGYKGSLSNQYHVSRLVEPGNSKEMYRAHFDSHLFTIVFPIKIPVPKNSGSSGELIYFPNSRKPPKNEIHNFIGKAFHKKYASKEGLDNFGKNNNMLVDNFIDYKPLLFIGNTTLHTNKPVTKDCSSYRLTLLAHFFDPSPKFGIGNILRTIRKR